MQCCPALAGPLQTAWNEVIVPFLWGVGDEPPLRYRLLPAHSFFGGVGEPGLGGRGR